MTLWIALVALSLLALSFVAWPMFRQAQRFTTTIALVIVFIVSTSTGLYYFIGSPTVQSGAGEGPDIQQMVMSLASRLESNPNDINGWLMLGRSYQTLGDFAQSVEAYEKAMALEDGQNAQTLVALALVLIERDNGVISGRATGLLESSLALAPNDPNALFYSGFAAATRGDTLLAAARWEILLGLNAPPEVRTLLQERINEWRGVAPQPLEQPGAIVVMDVSVSARATEQLPDEATVFVIARDPGQPSPPIAVTRRQLSELPLRVELGDADSMVPGRSLSGFSEFEVLARVSLSGNPIAASGDWFGARTIGQDAGVVSLEIDTPVE